LSLAENVTPPDELERLRQARANPAPGRYKDAAGREYEDAMEFLRAQLRVDVVRAEKVGRLHDLVLRDASRVTLGTAGDMLEPRKLRAALLDRQVVIPRHKGEQVDHIAQAVADVIEVLDPNAEEDGTRAWLAEFARGHLIGPLDLDDPAELERLLKWQDTPTVPVFFKGADGRVYVKLDPLVGYVTRHLARSTREDMIARLRRLGFTDCRIEKRVGADKRLRGRTWQSPPDFDPLGED